MANPEPLNLVIKVNDGDGVGDSGGGIGDGGRDGRGDSTRGRRGRGRGRGRGREGRGAVRAIAPSQQSIAPPIIEASVEVSDEERRMRAIAFAQAMGLPQPE